jgi:hypothetical protein
MLCRIVAPLAILATSAVLTTRRLADFDLPWRLASGRQIVATHSIPRVDDLTFPHLPIPYSGWLGDLATYAAFRAGGTTGLQVAAGLLGALVLAVLWAEMHRAREERASAWLVLALAAVAMSTWLTLRPAVVTFALAGVTLLAIDVHRRAPGTLKGRAALLALGPLALPWAVIHQGSVALLPMVGAYLVHRAACRVFGRSGDGWRARLLPAHDGSDLGICALTLAVAAAALLCTPGIGILLSKAGSAGADMRAIATEWAATTPTFLIDTELGAGLFLVVAAVALAFGRGEDGARIPALFDLAIAALAASALPWVRGIPLAVVLLAPLTARRLDPLLRPIPFARAPAAAVLLAVAPIVFFRTTDQRGSGFEPRNFPEPAVAWIEEKRPSGNMWNFSPFGGYLEWRLYPSFRPFIDGRILDYPLAARARAAEFDAAVFEPLAREYAMEWAVCGVSEWELFCLPIAASSDWTMVFWDDNSAVYVRRDGPNAALARQGYGLFRHLTGNLLALQHATAPASADEAAELRHDGDLAAAQAPGSARALFLATCGALAARDRPAFDAALARLAREAPSHPSLAILSHSWPPT